MAFSCCPFVQLTLYAKFVGNLIRQIFAKADKPIIPSQCFSALRHFVHYVRLLLHKHNLLIFHFCKKTIRRYDDTATASSNIVHSYDYLTKMVVTIYVRFFWIRENVGGRTYFAGMAVNPLASLHSPIYDKYWNGTFIYYLLNILHDRYFVSVQIFIGFNLGTDHGLKNWIRT